MNTEKIERLKEGGIDVDDALARFMGNEALLERFLNKFCDDKNYEELVKATRERDIDAMIKASHSMKGMCGNLSMTDLFELLTTQLAELRGGNADKAIELMTIISEAYEKIVSAIKC